MIKQSAFSDALKSTSAQGAAAGGALGLLASLFSKNRSLKRSLGWTAAGGVSGGLAGKGFAALQGKLVKKEKAPALLSQPETAEAVRKNKGIGVGGAIGIGAGAAAAGGAGYGAYKWYRMPLDEREYIKWLVKQQHGGLVAREMLTGGYKAAKDGVKAFGSKAAHGYGKVRAGGKAAYSLAKKHPTAAGVAAGFIGAPLLIKALSGGTTGAGSDEN